jgi:hypothetical protein
LVFQGELYPVFVAWDAMFVIRDESSTLGAMFPWSAPVSMIKITDQDGDPVDPEATYLN